MKKTKILSLLLSLSLFCTLIAPGTTAYAEGETKPGSGENGMKISKTATANGDGTYTITLEAFATGEKTTQTTDVPTDIVLVLDQSGSMGEDMGTVSFSQYKDEQSWAGTTYHTRNQDYYDYRHNGGSGNLWHQLPDGSYVSVSVARQEKLSYTPITNGKNNSTSGGATNYWNNRKNLYARVNGEYVTVTVNRDNANGTYTYTLPNGTQIASMKGLNKSPKFTGIEGDVIYLAAADYTYTYTYTDSNGTVQTIGTPSEGAETVFSPTLYEKVTNTSGGGTRIAALKTAATTFAEAVAKKAAGADGDINNAVDNIDHRIAVVGYADTDSRYGYNTGVFIGKALNRYPTDAAGVYGTALQDMSRPAGKSNVTASIDALTASGATRTDLGLTMAQGILDANPVTQGKRNRVVIVFTDGSPTSSNGFERTVANNAITTANAIKDGGTTVYSIGIFSGADASIAGEEPDKDYYDNFLAHNYTEAEMSAACNWFMQKVSSNNGTPQQPSYYLSAGDAASLNSIFKQISSNIGGSSTTLGSETVVKDIISPYFTLPKGATKDDIRIDTYKCTGKDSNGDYTWSQNIDAMGAKATINGDQVSVTGFNFSENWCGTETDAQGTKSRGNKLVISFNVEPKAGFLGGNEVYTNTSAGIYENGSAENPLLTFDRPTVNVPIKDVTVTAEDKNVYLKGEVTSDQLKNGATVKVGDVKLDLSKANDATKPYGLEPWQTKYVNITVAVKDKDGHEISADSLKNLTDDKTYTVEVTVAPTTKGTSTDEKGLAATEQSNNANANINVFKPELTFKDSTAYYGAAVPEKNDYSGNKVSEKWMHNGTEADPSKMLGEKPTLGITYTPKAGKTDNGKYTKQDVPVSATVKIGDDAVNQYTRFVHEKCTEAGCSWTDPTTTPGDPAFLIHVKTCTLNITKQGGANDESYVFDVYKDGNGNKYSEVTIWGNDTATLYELPVGTYTIEENTGWSWRYTANNGSGAELTAQTPTGRITCNNTQNNYHWLNGFSEVHRNIFGKSNSSN